MNSALLQGSFEKRNKAEEGRAKAKLSEDKGLRNGNTDSLLIGRSSSVSMSG